jgi:hypothetical protein
MLVLRRRERSVVYVIRSERAAVVPLRRHEPFDSRARMRLEEHCADCLGHRM